MALTTTEVDALRDVLNDREAVQREPFDLLRRIAAAVNSATDDSDSAVEAQELVLRALEQRNAFTGYEHVLDALVRSVGLFPYLDPTELGMADVLAYEFHRPLNMDSDPLVLHAKQGEVYRELLAGNSVVLGAPTSFGKSLVIDALIAAGKFSNLVIIVPTIALMDETRRRLVARFGGQYRVITYPGRQEVGGRNIFVVTQERLLEMPDVLLERVEFFAADEFYNLDPRSNDDRSQLLNHAVYRLLRRGVQFYLLGPPIRQIPEGFPARFRCTFINTDYATVVSESSRVGAKGATKVEREGELIDLCRRLDEPTLIYCQSPASTRAVARLLIEAQVATGSAEAFSAADWVAREYNPDWLVGRALRGGVGIHHGRVPRSLAQWAVRAFEEDHVRFLVCTSTLIEGVNTKAKNVIVYDNQIAGRNLDVFTFNNIRGRSGRMFKHFIGRVYLFYEPPTGDLPDVDIPLFTQTDSASDSLLIQMEQGDLSPAARTRVNEVFGRGILPPEVLRANSGIDPGQQIALAEDIESRLPSVAADLAWTQFPDYTQLQLACKLLWQHFILPNKFRDGDVTSPAQFAFHINRIARDGLMQHLQSQASASNDADAAVEGILHVARTWVTHRFPRYLAALDRVQRVVLLRAGFEPGDYSVYAAAAENAFVEPNLIALDEYGLPIQVSQRLARRLRPLGDPLDILLERLKGLDPDVVLSDPFERSLLRHVQEGL